MESSDFEKGHLSLMSELSPFDIGSITQEAYTEFVVRAGKNVWVIEDAGRIIASGTLIIESKLIHGLSAVGHIEDIVVTKDMRGRSIGHTLIAHLVAMAKQHGCYKVILDCNDHNIPFYEGCGFICKGNALAIYF